MVLRSTTDARLSETDAAVGAESWWISAAFTNALVVTTSYAVLLAAAVAGYLVGFPISRGHAAVALLAGGGLGALWSFPRIGGRRTATTIATAFGVLLLAGWASDQFYDVSWDGRDYHRRAALLFAEGFNPYLGIAEPQGAYYNRWINHFPRGPWVAHAAAISATGSIEVGKAVNLWLVWASFCAALAAFAHRVDLRSARTALPHVALAAAIALNPIAVSQLFTNYVDGQAASLLAIVVLLGWRAAERPATGSVGAAAAATMVALNIKFTVTGILIFWAPVIGLGIWTKAKSCPRRVRMRVVGSLIAGAAVGFVGLGWTPYMRNAVQFGHPFYPIFGQTETYTQVDPAQISPDFLSLPRAERVARSLLGRSQNDHMRVDARIKVPFSVSGRELDAMRDADVRLGGFGPWFGGCLLIAAAGLVVLRAGVHFRWLLLGVVFAALPALLNAGGWWARFHPQLWYIPVAVAGSLVLVGARGRRTLGWALLIALLVNSTLVAGARAYEVGTETRRINALLDSLQRKAEPITIFQAWMVGSERLLEGRGIPYTEVSDSLALRCPSRALIGPVLYAPVSCAPP